MSDSVRTPYRNLGMVVKTQGLKGEVVICAITDVPLSHLLGCEVFFTPPALRGINHARVIHVEEASNGAIVSLEGIESVDTAKDLVGRTLLARRVDIPADGDRREDLIGRRVRCVERGELGSITEVMETPANDVWIVKGNFGEALIPVIDDLDIRIPEDADKPIELHLLRGLIDDEAEVISEGDGASGADGTGSDGDRADAI